MSAALELQRVRATVPDGERERVLFNDLNLSLSAGEMVAISGASGSGKSTLLALAGLLRRPQSGEVLITGEPTAAIPEHKRTRLRRSQIGIVYQSANLVPNLTAIEQLQLVQHINGSTGRGAYGRAQALLDQLGIGYRSEALPGKLSGGERQRVGIARALIAEPEVLLADEPSAALDPEMAVAISELLVRRTREDGLATLVVSHDDAPIRQADRHLELRDRQLTEVSPRS